VGGSAERRRTCVCVVALVHELRRAARRRVAACGIRRSARGLVRHPGIVHVLEVVVGLGHLGEGAVFSGSTISRGMVWLGVGRERLTLF
jgi:hypothetical protein